MARNRLNLLTIVQRVLDSLGSDQVNSISDTVESQQIANEAMTVYYELMDRDEWPHLIQNRQLQAVSNSSYPNYLEIPEDVVEIRDFRYEVTESGDTNREFRTIQHMEPNEFLDYVHRRNSSDTNIETVQDFGGFDLWIVNDEPPRYWTTFDDQYVVTDAWDSDVDSTLQQSKSIIRAKTMPAWTNSDTFIPDMPDDMFSTFLAELTSAVFVYLKGTQSPKDEQRARRGMSNLRRNAGKFNERNRKADYGRKRGRIYGSLDGSRGSIEAQYWP
jgi:hypothetical protein